MAFSFFQLRGITRLSQTFQSETNESELTQEAELTKGGYRNCSIHASDEIVCVHKGDRDSGYTGKISIAVGNYGRHLGGMGCGVVQK